MPHQLAYTQSKLDFVIFGGGGGGGKTFASLCDNLQGIHDKHYISTFFRTTTTEIEKGLWLEAKALYEPLLRDKKGKWIGKSHISEIKKTITFPSGAKTFFGYLELDRHADGYYGIEITKIYFEEIQFRSWYQFNTLRSRNRSKARVTKGIRATCNPDQSHFVFDFVKRFLDEDGYPIKSLSNKTAYYLIYKDALITAWTKEEIQEKYPDKNPLTYTYIPATIEDNKVLNEIDPTYKDTLDSLPEIKRKQLLEGCWIDTGDNGIYFKSSWLKECDYLPMGTVGCRAYDLAFSEPTPNYPKPDYTAGVMLHKDREGNFYLVGDYTEDFCDKENTNVKGRFRLQSGKRDKLILKQALHDGLDIPIILPEDAGAAGKDSFREKVKYFTANGVTVKKDTARHTASKLTKFEPFCTAAEHGLVYIVTSSFNPDTRESLLTELNQFNNERSTSSRKDDRVDAVATAYNYLSKVRNVKTVVRNQRQSDTIASSHLKNTSDVNIKNINKTELTDLETI